MPWGGGRRPLSARVPYPLRPERGQLLDRQPRIMVVCLTAIL